MLTNNIVKVGVAATFAFATMISMLAFTSAINAQQAYEQDFLPENLNLTSVCSTVPENTRRWRVQNTNPMAVDFRWEVVGTSQSGSLTAPAAGSGVIKFPGATDGADYTFFEAETVAGPNTTTIFWDRGEVERSTTKASGGATCDSFFQFGKTWSGDTVDLSDVTVEFTANLGEIDFSWTLGEDGPVEVIPGETTLTNVQEVITGLPDNCTYESDVPSTITAPTSGYDAVTNVVTMNVTNTVDCSETVEEDDPSVLADTDEKQVTVTPVGSADAGGSGATALVGLVGSTAAVSLGAVIRKFSL